jgi:hypothetical protein
MFLGLETRRSALKFVEITISAATKEERRKIVGLIAVAAVEVEASLTELQPTGPSRKKAIEIGTVVTVLLQGAAAIGSGLVANMIYDKIKAASRAPDRLVKRSTETEVEIIDENLGHELS